MGRMARYNFFFLATPTIDYFINKGCIGRDPCKIVTPKGRGAREFGKASQSNRASRAFLVLTQLIRFRGLYPISAPSQKGEVAGYSVLNGLN